ncbi:hypothetical protein pah_c022o175 [Parachlamydia acanthamoebae str. Hall's coccus]|nr:hypothetical protein pah_c022o175 [Parachlamydia acanthamoebae str. Hall's coccus]
MLTAVVIEKENNAVDKELLKKKLFIIPRILMYAQACYKECAFREM